MNIEMDVEDYICLLEDRVELLESRGESVPNRAVLEFLYDLIRDCGVDPKRASPSYVIDNLVYNSEYDYITDHYFENEEIFEINNICKNLEVDEVESELYEYFIRKDCFGVAFESDVDDIEDVTLVHVKNIIDRNMSSKYPNIKYTIQLDYNYSAQETDCSNAVDIIIEEENKDLLKEVKNFLYDLFDSEPHIGVNTVLDLDDNDNIVTIELIPIPGCYVITSL